jgi:hypothetical protein
MQIDFHHTATYTCARLAGLTHDQASIVAYSAQYVDDATQAGLVEFLDGSTYRRAASAHKALDYKNFSDLAQSRVWIPFHFMPGNGGLSAGEVPPGGRSEQLRVVPNSPPARAMVTAAIQARARPWALQRLGIAMHVYADTWSHQGFTGVRDDVNDASDLRWADGRPASAFTDRLRSWFVSAALPLGHGAVLSLPDRPYARWSYQDGLGRRVHRDNPTDFLAAADHMVQWMTRWRLQDHTAVVPGLPADARRVFEELIAMEAEEHERHAAWRGALAHGRFGFERVDVDYAGRGPGSWKREALGVDEVDGVVPITPEFQRSAWKRFHDALLEHQFEVLHVILPRYGILAD